MIITWASKRLRDLCENDQIAITELGMDNAKSLAMQIADIEAASSIQDIPFMEKVDDDKYRSTYDNVEVVFSEILSQGDKVGKLNHRIKIIKINNHE